MKKQSSEPKTNVLDYKHQIEKHLLQGQQVEPLDAKRKSLFRCNNLFLEMRASKKSGNLYFFQTSADQRRLTDYSIFVCANHDEAFCIKSDVLTSLTLSKSKTGKFYVFNLEIDGPIGLSYLYVNKDEASERKIDITEYCIPLYNVI